MSDFEKVSRLTQPNISLASGQNAAVTQMAQELIEYRKGNSKTQEDLSRLQSEKDGLVSQNLQLSQ